MSDWLGPAVVADEWRTGHVLRAKLEIFLDAGRDLVIGGNADQSYSIHSIPEDIAAIIACANGALPDGDPRKITREWAVDEREAYRNAVQLARYAQDRGDEAECQRFAALAARHRAHADALESYLPPE